MASPRPSRHLHAGSRHRGLVLQHIPPVSSAATATANRACCVESPVASARRLLRSSVPWRFVHLNFSQAQTKAYAEASPNGLFRQFSRRNAALQASSALSALRETVKSRPNGNRGLSWRSFSGTLAAQSFAKPARQPRPFQAVGAADLDSDLFVHAQRREAFSS